LSAHRPSFRPKDMLLRCWLVVLNWDAQETRIMEWQTKDEKRISGYARGITAAQSFGLRGRCTESPWISLK
jgi:hypothetical protein